MKCEVDVWKLIQKCIKADFVFFQNDEKPAKRNFRTPMSLIDSILKNDHELLSYHYIIKWLESIFRQEKYLNQSLIVNIEKPKHEKAERNLDIDNYQEFLSKSANDADKMISCYLYESMRAGKLESAKEKVKNVKQMWKGSLLNGISPAFDSLIDKSLDPKDVENIGMTDIDKNCQIYGNSDWLLYLRSAYFKSKCEDANDYERALFGSL